MIHPLDSYEHYREGATSELCPFQIHGRRLSHLLAAMSVVRFGNLTIESLSFAAGSEVEARRTKDLIRSFDPECYQIYLSVNGGHFEEQAGNQIVFRPRDLALYDPSLPQHSINSTNPTGMRVILLSIPKAMVPIPPKLIQPYAGRLLPRNLHGYSFITQLLINLADSTEHTDEFATESILHDYAVEMISQRVGTCNEIRSATLRALRLACIRSTIHQHHADATLDLQRVADAANISLRSLHKICQEAEITPMQLLKQVRLNACRDTLHDPRARAMTIKAVHTSHGYGRSDQFARDFKKQFGVSPKEFRLHTDPL
ncbi:AraC family transcriptional regulator [Plantactinospora sp. KBS50]|uniref:AraC family transcriptional regulator n=1 Tax=Plantactinospora sp. KBS50 TaxID=2024580 RepID=UPI0018DF8ACB|nr:AraC family transcriptional regulator [Plantactinospora sp. KBS50]